MARAALVSATALLAPAVALALLCVGCSRPLRQRALKEHSLSMCSGVPHEAGASCAAEVSRRFERCSPALLDNRVTPETYARCLGFIIDASAAGPAK